MHPGVTFYDKKDVLTKAEAQAIIDEYEYELSIPWDEYVNNWYPGGEPMGDVDPENAKARLKECEKYVEIYKELLPTLPESDDLPVADFKFHPYNGYYVYMKPEIKDIFDDVGVDYDYFNRDSEQMYIRATLDNGLTVCIDAVNENRENEKSSSIHYVVGKIHEDGVYISRDELHDCTLTEEQMDELCNTALEGLGIADVMVQSSKKQYGKTWVFEYRRSLRGFDVKDVQLDNDYAYVPGNEVVTIEIEDDMITKVSYENPYAVLNPENENVELISFEEAYDSFKKQAALEYTKASVSGVWDVIDGVDTQIGDAVLSAELTVKTAKLVMVRIPVKDGGFRYVPAWQFSGDKKLEQDTSSKYYSPADETNFLFMTINAIDGTRIAGMT